MIVRPAPEPLTWRRTPLSGLLLALMMLWLASPLFWLDVTSRVGPDSGSEATPDQARALRIVNLLTLCYVVLAPALVLVVSWWTRRRVILALTLAALALGALALAALLMMG